MKNLNPSEKIIEEVEDLHLGMLATQALAGGQEIISHDIVKKAIRKPGVWDGQVTIEKDFDEMPDDFIEHFK